MSEGKLWKEIRDNVGHKGHFSRIESHATANGYPDVDYCINGTENKLELKFAIDKVPEIRSSQVRWFKKRIKAGGNPLIFAKIIVGGEAIYMLFDGHLIEKLARNGDILIWEPLARAIWYRDMDWNRFIVELRR